MSPLRYRASSGYMFLVEPQQAVRYALYNAGVRTYNTDTGRWLQEDPIVGIPTDPMSFNRYLYCNADPINKEDPSGLSYSASGAARAPAGYPLVPPGAGLPSNPPGSIPAKPGPTTYMQQTCPGWMPVTVAPCPARGWGSFLWTAAGGGTGGLLGAGAGGASGGILAVVGGAWGGAWGGGCLIASIGRSS